MRKKIQITLKEWGTYDIEDMSGNLSDFIARLEDLREQIPEEHRDMAQLTASSDSDYDGGYIVNVSIWYERPETDEEMEARKAGDRNREWARAAELEARERAELARLKAKYGSEG